MRQIVLVALCLLTLASTARDRLYIEDITIEAGQTIRIPIILQNDTVYSAFQTDLYLPEGLVVVEDAGEFVIDLTERAGRNHTVSSFRREDGAIRIFVASQSLMPFTENSGPIATIEIHADANVNGDLLMHNSILVEENGVKHIADNCVAHINGNETVNGDVTGDGSVDIGDVNAVINMMLGKTEQTAAGDVTGDGNVDIGDVNAVINIMLGKE